MVDWIYNFKMEENLSVSNQFIKLEDVEENDIQKQNTQRKEVIIH